MTLRSHSLLNAPTLALFKLYTEYKALNSFPNSTSCRSSRLLCLFSVRRRMAWWWLRVRKNFLERQLYTEAVVFILFSGFGYEGLNLWRKGHSLSKKNP